MILTTLLANWRYGLFVMLLASNAFTYGMWRLDAQALDKVKLANAVAEEAHKRVVIEQKQITEDTTNGWKAALDFTRAYYKRLRSVPAGQGVRIPDTSKGTYGYTANAIPSTTDLAEACAETTLQLNSLQDWVLKQEKAR